MSKVDHTTSATETPLQEVIRRDSNLRLISSPVATGLEDHEKGSRLSSMGLNGNGKSDIEHLKFHNTDERNCPEFIKHTNSTNYELFYDLWFVANLEVFSSSKGINKESDLYAYVGYLSILWFTWFNVGMFDVRFVTDSIFERTIRTAHLGVMVGFSVVVTYFDPQNQDQPSFQTLSYILMVSRLVLFFQYGVIIWHIRRYKNGKAPVAFAAAVHLVAAMIYLGIGFRFQEGKNSRVYIVWYIVAAVEALTQLGLANFYKVLTFTKTHLTERMTVLTVIILGAGVTSIAKNVVLIVKNAAGWTSGTIGVLISAISLMYFFFMLYFDWMKHHHLSGWRQLSWTIFHFPFHVCLLLFMEGATQFMVWWKVREVEEVVAELVEDLGNRLASPELRLTGDVVANELNDTIQYIFAFYPPTYTLTQERVTTLITDIRNLPQDFWDNGSEAYPTEGQEYLDWVAELIIAVVNSLFTSFKIDPFDGMVEDDPTKMQVEALEDLNTRFYTVFQYAYVTAGLVLMLMVIMFALARKQGWMPFVIFRTTLFGLMGLGLALVELISKNEERAMNYLGTPMLLPTICVVFFVVLLLSHLPHPPSFLSRRKNSGYRPSSYGHGAYASVQVREVDQNGSGLFDGQGYDPNRWGNGGMEGTNVYMQHPSPEMTYHNAYGQTGDFGSPSPPLKHH